MEKLKVVARPEQLIGSSPAVERARRLVHTLAPESWPVLLEGETGTGKELAARGLHAESGRTGPFVPVNCATLRDTLMESELFGHERGAFTGAVGRKLGMMEEAAGGTLFLDEIGELPPALQARLLRVLDEGEVRRVGANRAHKVDVRIVAATNRNLEREIASGRFREDLYHRLKVGHIVLPPLRERPEDIPLLADHFLDGRPIASEVTEMLRRYAWPGNVRELRHVLTYADVMSGRKGIRVEHLPEELRSGRDPLARIGRDPGSPPAHPASRDLPMFMFRGVRPLHALEADYVRWVVAACGGNRREAARRLGIDPKTLRRKLATDARRAAGGANGDPQGG
jgi:DNA-binding NtrC family response regulator